MLEEIERLNKEVEDSFSQVDSLEDIEKLKVKYLGRKAVLNQLFARLPQLSREEKVEAGRALNRLKGRIQQLVDEGTARFKSQEEKIDLTFPATKLEFGRKHVLSAVSRRICEIFEDLGFVVIEGKEVEDEWHNFEALNIPLEHPSREVFDTFYLDLPPSEGGKYLLRSHTSPSQIRVMEKMSPPLAVISPGRVYRPDKVDASHSFMFHQIEGFYVNREVTFAQLKGVLLHFAKKFFSPEVELRFRPHFFPFTEPSAEVDISCMICGGTGCSVCSRKGWLEILGCGMIHPRVLTNCGIDTSKYTGFAFGMGVERIVMLKYQINDIRLFYENDVRFLDQFYEV